MKLRYSSVDARFATLRLWFSAVVGGRGVIKVSLLALCREAISRGRDTFVQDQSLAELRVAESQDPKITNQILILLY